MKNLYMVEYFGSYMGGLAIVSAESEEDAICKVEHHPQTIMFRGKPNDSVTYEPTVTLLDPESGKVLYNANGEY